MSKYIFDFKIIQSVRLTARYQLITLLAPENADLSIIKAGQFVQIRVDNSQSTFLRRPISVHDVDVDNNLLIILVARAGDGTNAISNLPVGSYINIMWPLGNGFDISTVDSSQSVLLVGGGVGVAPLLYLGKKLKDKGLTPKFLLAARTADDLLQLEQFSAVGDVYVSTDDGSAGQKGLVTTNEILTHDFDHIYCCGPMPMMKAVASICSARNIDCQVSLENVMACGIGACLCCVEKTTKGNVCVCTNGPVFNINQLTW